MIRTWKLWLILFFLILGIPGLAGAAGYGIYEWGARGQALGGAMTARGEDPSTVVYNPAAMTQLPGTHVSAGMTFIQPSGTVEPDDSSLQGGEGEDNTWIIPNAYLTTQLGERYWFGMGLYSRTGLGTEYDDDENWFGRYNSMYAGIKQISLTPNMAIKLTDSLSMGVGLEVAYIEVNLQSMADPLGNYDGNSDVKQKLTGGDSGYGFNLALHYKPVDWLSFGASYRSKIEVTMNGDADFSNIGDTAVAGNLATLAGQTYGDSFKATEPLPAMLSLGVMVKPLDKLSVSFDLLRTYWSAYNELKIEMTDSALTPPYNPIIKEKSNYLPPQKF